MKSRTHRQNFSALFSEEEKAKMAYNTDMRFRKFVKEWDIDNPETLGYTYGDFYRIYKTGEMRLQFNY